MISKGGVLAVATGAQVGGDPLTPDVHLEGSRGQPNLDGFLREAIGHANSAARPRRDSRFRPGAGAIPRTDRAQPATASASVGRVPRAGVGVSHRADGSAAYR